MRTSYSPFRCFLLRLPSYFCVLNLRFALRQNTKKNLFQVAKYIYYRGFNVSWHVHYFVHNSHKLCIFFTHLITFCKWQARLENPSENEKRLRRLFATHYLYLLRRSVEARSIDRHTHEHWHTTHTHTDIGWEIAGETFIVFCIVNLKTLLSLRWIYFC